MEEARQLFRDKERTEFIIVTIPTAMAVAESERLATSLETEQVPVKRILINQLVRTQRMHTLRVETLACLSSTRLVVLLIVLENSADRLSGRCFHFQSNREFMFGAACCIGSSLSILFACERTTVSGDTVYYCALHALCSAG